MDSDNLATLRAKAPNQPRARIGLFRDYDPEGAGKDVPDPYYGGPEGFREVVRIVERTAAALLDDLERD